MSIHVEEVRGCRGPDSRFSPFDKRAHRSEENDDFMDHMTALPFALWSRFSELLRRAPSSAGEATTPRLVRSDPQASGGGEEIANYEF